MAVSIASTMTPFLWKGRPSVVVRGVFVPGLASHSTSKLYPAVNLFLGASASAVGGQTFSLQVTGRDEGLDSTVVYSGIAFLKDWDDYQYVDLGRNPSTGFPGGSPWGQTDPGPYVAPRLARLTTYMNTGGYDKNETAEANARRAIPKLGSLVSREVSVIFRGSLSSLDTRKFTAGSFVPVGDGLYSMGTGMWYSNYKYSGFTPPGVGWRISSVHVFDQPALRRTGRLYVADGVPVSWDSGAAP